MSFLSWGLLSTTFSSPVAVIVGVTPFPAVIVGVTPFPTTMIVGVTPFSSPTAVIVGVPPFDSVGAERLTDACTATLGPVWVSTGSLEAFSVFTYHRALVAWW